MEIKTVSFVGAGNVATHLCTALHRAGLKISTVSARTIESAQRLAGLVGARACAVDKADTDADFVIIAVSDKAVATAAAQLPPGRAIVAHTSGSIPLDDISDEHRRPAAVLYPLQTFSSDVAVDIARVPFFTEATDKTVLDSVDTLARMMSANVYHADSEKRRSLHVAGVLTCNFPVYLLEMAESVLAKAGFPLEVVHPLAEATLQKAFAVGPHQAMTGPARRGDTEVCRLQAESLEGIGRQIYETLTTAILNDYK